MVPNGFIKDVLNFTSYSLDKCFPQSNCNQVVAPRNTPVEDRIRSQVQSAAEFTDHRFSHFKLRKDVNFKSLQQRICPKL